MSDETTQVVSDILQKVFSVLDKDELSDADLVFLTKTVGGDFQRHFDNVQIRRIEHRMSVEAIKSQRKITEAVNKFDRSSSKLAWAMIILAVATLIMAIVQFAHAHPGRVDKDGGGGRGFPAPFCIWGIIC